MWTDISTVVLSIAIIFFAFMQWLEMHGTSKQTDNLVLAANAISGHQKQMVDDNKTNLAQNAAAIEKTLRENRDELAKMLGDNRDALKANLKQGQSALDAGINASRLDQRAWIGVKGIRDLHLEAGKPVAVTVVFVNTGKTPAVKAQISSYMEYVGPHGSPSLRAPESVDEASNTVIHPGQESWSVLNNGDLALTGTMTDAIALRTGNLYVRIVVTYDDIFARHHSTHYCGIASRDLSSIGSCATGNYSD